jgi:hypothetical protein
MKNGKWKMANGKWQMENGKSSFELAPSQSIKCNRAVKGLQ